MTASESVKRAADTSGPITLPVEHRLAVVDDVLDLLTRAA